MASESWKVWVLIYPPLNITFDNLCYLTMYQQHDCLIFINKWWRDGQQFWQSLFHNMLWASAVPISKYSDHFSVFEALFPIYNLQNLARAAQLLDAATFGNVAFSSWYFSANASSLSGTPRLQIPICPSQSSWTAITIQQQNCNH